MSQANPEALGSQDKKPSLLSRWKEMSVGQRTVSILIGTGLVGGGSISIAAALGAFDKNPTPPLEPAASASWNPTDPSALPPGLPLPVDPTESSSSSAPEQVPATVDDPCDGLQIDASEGSVRASMDAGTCISNYYDEKYGPGVCTLDAHFNKGVSWDLTITTPDGSVSYTLLLSSLNTSTDTYTLTKA